MNSIVFSDRNNLLHLDWGMRLSWMVFLSLAAHILVLTFFLNRPKPSLPVPPFVPVSLVALKRPLRSVPLSPQSPSLPAPPVQNIPPPVQEETAGKPSVTPETIPEAPRLSSHLHALTPVETAPLKHPNPASPVQNKTTSPADSLQNTGNPPSASISAVSSDNEPFGAEGPSKYPYYFEGIQSKISAFWIIPSDLDAIKGNPLAVVIGFVVQRDGQIKKKSINIEKSSGNPFWDASALRAIYNADPLLPLPKEVTEELHVHFEFKFHS